MHHVPDPTPCKTTWQAVSLFISCLERSNNNDKFKKQPSVALLCVVPPRSVYLHAHEPDLIRHPDRLVHGYAWGQYPVPLTTWSTLTVIYA